MKLGIVRGSAVLSVLLCFGIRTAESRDLTFEQRVEAERAIERVYYSHQIGVKGSFVETVPRAVLERKIHTYLEQSAALDVYWKTPVTDEMLQSELDRMIRRTALPDRLRELFASLKDDPFVVKECLVRAALVGRLSREFYAYDPALHDETLRRADALRQQLEAGGLDPRSSYSGRSVVELAECEQEAAALKRPATEGDQPAGERSSRECLTSEEFRKARAGLPIDVVGAVSMTEEREAFAVRVLLSETPRNVQVARYLVPKRPWDDWWASKKGELANKRVDAVSSEGDSSKADFVRSTAALKAGRTWTERDGNPPGASSFTCAGDDTWDSGTAIGAPSGTTGHTAIWTGNVMVVWGGYNGFFPNHNVFNTGGRYNPVTDVWTPTSITNAPGPRSGHIAVWTGNEMVVWGGLTDPSTASWVNSGGRYNPVTDLWTPTSITNAPDARSGHAAVWTGSLVVVWGGSTGPTNRNTGGRYNPLTDGWTPTSITDAPVPRALHTAVWTGTEMIIWGGAGVGSYVNTGGRYNPVTDSWTATPIVDAPVGRAYHTALWTGTKMIVWGGGFPPLTSGGRYDPVADAWTPTSLAPAPQRTAEHSAIWTDTLMIAWGGGDQSGTTYNRGARYNPDTDFWSPTTNTDAPAPRVLHTAIWTGSRMIIWGGRSYFTPLDPRIPGRYALGYSSDDDGDGYSECQGDCNDRSATSYPGASQLCDGSNNNCDDPAWPAVPANEADADHDGSLVCHNDCDERNPRTYPGAPEICDNRDNDCDGLVDEGVNLDLDNDGYTTCQNDCDDTDNTKDPRPGHGCDSANNGQAPNAPITSDPVNVATGNFTQEDTDFRMLGRGIDLVLSRQYNSKSPSDGPLGYGWTHSFQVRLAVGPNGSRTATMEDGHTEIYSPDGAGGFTAPYGLWNKLAANPGGTFSLTRKDDRLRFDFDASGILQRVVDKNGNQIICGYSGGLLTTLTDTVGRVVSLTYNPSNRIEHVDFPVGRSIQYAYGPAGDLTSVTDARGFTTEYTYDADHQLLTIEDRRNNIVVTNIYDATSRVVSSQHDAYGDGTTFVYDWVANKTDVTDPLGKTTTFWYDAFGKTLRVRDPLGNELSYVYDAAGQRTSMTDKAAKTTLFTYDARGNILTRTDPDTAVTTFEYDANDHVLKRTDPLLFHETFAYDANGNQTQWVDRTGETETRTYTPQGQLAAVVDRRGKTTSYVYLSDGTLDTTTDRRGKISSFTHDGAGRRLTARDPNLNTTTYTYDANDHVTEVMDALGRLVHYGFDANGNPTTVEDPSGAITTTFYDLKNRVETVRDPLLHDTTYEYDADDRKRAEIDPRGNRTEFFYDDVGNLIRRKDALLYESLFTYDAAGRRLTAKDPENHTTTWTYDSMGRVLTVKDPLLNSTTKTYDLRGDELTIQDPRGKTTHYERDGEQRLIAIVDALGGRSEFTFDAEGNRKTLRNANSHVTSYAYDDAGNLLTVTDPVGNVTEYGYDDGGRRSLRKDALLRPTTYGYDGANRLQQITYPDTTVATFTYSDLPRNRSMTDATGTTTRQYDAAGRTTAVQDGSGRTLSYTYDAAGNRTSMTLPGPLTMTYAYDALNRLSTVSDWGFPAGTATYTYSPAGRVDGVALPNGTSETLQYDAAGRMTRQTASGATGTIVDYVITLDSSGNRTAIERTQPLSGTVADADETYLYDVGERIVSRGLGTYAHDANGDMTTRMDDRGTQTFEYDFDDRMHGVARGFLMDLYSYDAEGNRIRADRAGTVTQYLLDHAAPMVEAVGEYDGLGNPVRYNVQGHRLLWSLDALGNRFVYHTDPVGSVTAVTDDTQNITAAFDYDEFGDVTASTVAFSTNACFVGSLGVTREPADLYFMRARHYDARLGRFLATDPANTSATTQETNPYAYAWNSPLSLTDPDGEHPVVIALAAVGIVWAGVHVYDFVHRSLAAVDDASKHPATDVDLNTVDFDTVRANINQGTFGTVKSIGPSAIEVVSSPTSIASAVTKGVGVTLRGFREYLQNLFAKKAEAAELPVQSSATTREPTPEEAAMLRAWFGGLLRAFESRGIDANVRYFFERSPSLPGECIKAHGGGRCN